MTADNLSDLLRSPVTHAPLDQRGNSLTDGGEREIARRVGPVWSFLCKPDNFYEGKYNNRVRYAPRSDGLLATLPLRIVMQNYPTTVAVEVPRGATVVEIGCAGGLTWFGQRYRMIGIDLSLEALQMASRDYELTLQCDATCMPLADASIDAVISSCFFEHLTDGQKTSLLSEAARVLKPGGKLVFLYDLWTENKVIAWYRSADPDRYQASFLDHDGHVGYRTVCQNRSFFKEAGFLITREYFHERSPFLSNSAWQKLAKWPGIRGRVGSIGRFLTGGTLRVPMLTLLWVIDATLGRLFPQTHARCMITVAVRP